MRRLNSCSRRSTHVGSTLFLLLFGGHAMAADTASPSQTNNLEEIVVTAEKRNVDIQLVPVSVTAVSGDTLQALGATQLADYAQYVPGMIVATGGSPGQVSVSLRGIGGFGPGSTTGFYIDDSPVGSSANFAEANQFALDLMPYDLDRLEVLRGPQGTLYGAGAMGGLLKYVLKPADPSSFGAQAGFELNTTDHAGDVGYGVRSAVNLPLIANQLALRVSGYDQFSPGYVDNVRLNQKDVNDVRQTGGRVALTWLPSDTLKVNLNAMWSRIDSNDDNDVTLGNLQTHQDSDGVQFYTATPLFGSLGASHAYVQPFVKDLSLYSATIDWDLGYMTAVSASSFEHSFSNQIEDLTQIYGVYPELFGLPMGVSELDTKLGLDKITQEFRLVSPAGRRVEWLAGLFYTHEKSANSQLATVQDANYQPITGPYAAIFNPFFVFASLPTTYSEYAAFGNLTFNITDKWDLTGGLREAHNNQHFTQFIQGVVEGPAAVTTTASSDQSVFTWSASSRYRFTEQTMAYVRLATGYRPGGPNDVIPLSGAKPTVNSDTLKNYEVGLKSTLFDNRVVIDAAVYDIQWKGIQLGAETSSDVGYLANAGDAYSRGVEFDVSYMPIKGLRFGLTGAYNKSRVTTLIQGAPNFLLDTQLAGIPVYGAGLTSDYNWHLNDSWQANLGAGVHYSGEYWVSAPIAQGITTQNPAFTTADLHGGVSNARWNYHFYVRNLANRLVYQTGVPVANPLSGTAGSIEAIPLQPRTLGIAVDVKF
jgi:iron complex outermembrane receptor protein